MNFVDKTLLLISIILVPVLFICGWKYFGNNLPVPTTQTLISINDNWKYEWQESGNKGTVNFPCVLKDGSKGYTLKLVNRLSFAVTKRPTLFFRTSQQFVKVYLDQNSIYTYPEGNITNQGLPGSLWHFIDIPIESEGKEIVIKMKSPVSNYSGHINSIYVGDKTTLVIDIMKRYGPTLVLACTILLIGIVIFVLFWFLKNNKEEFDSMLYLGCFCILAGIWIGAESKIIQFIIYNPVLMAYLAFISLYLLPIPLLLFINKTFTPRRSKLLNYFVLAISAFFIIVSILQLLGMNSFIKALLLFHLMLLVCICAIIFVSIDEVLSGNKRIKIFFIGIVAMSVFSLCDLYGFYFSKTPGLNAQLYTQFGILVFILFMVASLSFMIVDMVDIKVRNDMYMSLAYTDILTGLKNRTSFEECISEINKNITQYTSINIIILDLNYLKEINDQYGHKEGDKYICINTKVINECFGDIGHVYRIGGDEFAVIIKDYDQDDVEQRVDRLDELIEEYDTISTYSTGGIAYGMAVFNEDVDKDLHTVIIRADKSMYQCKQKQKNYKLA